MRSREFSEGPRIELRAISDKVMATKAEAGKWKSENKKSKFENRNSKIGKDAKSVEHSEWPLRGTRKWKMENRNSKSEIRKNGRHPAGNIAGRAKRFGDVVVSAGE
jgi:hypothetical protein